MRAIRPLLSYPNLDVLYGAWRNRDKQGYTAIQRGALNCGERQAAIYWLLLVQLSLLYELDQWCLYLSAGHVTKP